MDEIQLLSAIQNRLDIISAVLLLLAVYIFFREIYKFLYNLFK